MAWIFYDETKLRLFFLEHTLHIFLILFKVCYERMLFLKMQYNFLAHESHYHYQFKMTRKCTLSINHLYNQTRSHIRYVFKVKQKHILDRLFSNNSEIFRIWHERCFNNMGSFLFFYDNESYLHLKAPTYFRKDDGNQRNSAWSLLTLWQYLAIR